MWLRVGTERASDLPHDCWDGLATANAVSGVPKPQVLDSIEWHAPDRQPPRRVRADLMTILSGRPCSPEEVLRTELDVPASWWSGLRAAYDALRGVPTERFSSRPAISPAIRDEYGNEVAHRMRVRQWETVHGDLHWNNLLEPEMGILDWEMWGRGPTGSDPATLYCYALLSPETAEVVWKTFQDVLESAAGQTALFRAAARLLHRAPVEYPDLIEPLRRLVSDAVPQHVFLRAEP